MSNLQFTMDLNHSNNSSTLTHNSFNSNNLESNEQIKEIIETNKNSEYIKNNLHNHGETINWIYKHLSSPKFKSLASWNKYMNSIANRIAKQNKILLKREQLNQEQLNQNQLKREQLNQEQLNQNQLNQEQVNQELELINEEIFNNNLDSIKDKINNKENENENFNQLANEIIIQKENEIELESLIYFLKHSLWSSNLKYCLGENFGNQILDLQLSLEMNIKKNINLHYKNLFKMNVDSPECYYEAKDSKFNEFLIDFQLVLNQVVDAKKNFEKNIEDTLQFIQDYKSERRIHHEKELLFESNQYLHDTKSHQNNIENYKLNSNNKSFNENISSTSSDKIANENKDAQTQIENIIHEEWTRLQNFVSNVNQWIKNTNEHSIIQKLLKELEMQTNSIISIDTFLKEYHKELNSISYEEIDWSDRVMKNIKNEQDRKMMILLRRVNQPLSNQLPWMNWNNYTNMKNENYKQNYDEKKMNTFELNKKLNAYKANNTFQQIINSITDNDLRHLKYLDKSYIISDQVMNQFEISIEKLVKIIYMNQISDYHLLKAHPMNCFSNLIEELLEFINLKSDEKECIISNLDSFSILSVLIHCYETILKEKRKRNQLEKAIIRSIAIVDSTISLTEKAKKINEIYHDDSWLKYSQMNHKHDLKYRFNKIFSNSKTCVRHFVKDCVEQSSILSTERLPFESLFPMYLITFHEVPFQEYDEQVLLRIVNSIHSNEAEQLKIRKSKFISLLSHQIEIQSEILNNNINNAIWNLKEEDFQLDHLKKISSDRLQLEIEYLQNSTKRTKLLVKNRNRNLYINLQEKTNEENPKSKAISKEVEPNNNLLQETKVAKKDTISNNSNSSESINTFNTLNSKAQVNKERKQLLGLIEGYLKCGISEDLFEAPKGFDLENLSDTLLTRLSFDYQLLNLKEAIISNGFHYLPRFVFSVTKLIPHYEKMSKHQQTFQFNHYFYQVHFSDWSKKMIEKYEKYITWMVKKLQQHSPQFSVTSTQIQREKILLNALQSTQNSKKLLWTKEQQLISLFEKYQTYNHQSNQIAKHILLKKKNQMDYKIFQQIWKILN